MQAQAKGTGENACRSADYLPLTGIGRLHTGAGEREGEKGMPEPGVHKHQAHHGDQHLRGWWDW